MWVELVALAVIVGGVWQIAYACGQVAQLRRLYKRAWSLHQEATGCRNK